MEFRRFILVTDYFIWMLTEGSSVFVDLQLSVRLNAPLEAKS
jgi:hypothetical protein